MRAKEIKEMYPSGTEVLDCFGQKATIIGSYLTVSEFHPAGTLVLGNVFIFDSVTNKWAKKLKD